MGKINQSLFLFLSLGILLLSCENPIAPGLGSGVDLDAPVVGISTPSNGAYVRGVITLSGPWNDDKGVTSGTVSVIHQATNVVQGTKNLDINADKTWTVSIDTTTYTDGEKVISVKVKDDSGRETETRSLLYFDNTPPIGLVNQPTDPLGIYNGMVKISGESYDPFGIDEVKIEVYSDSSLATLLTSAVLEGKTVWNYFFDSLSYVSTVQDLYYIVKVKDRAGNDSQYFFHYSEVYGLNGSVPITIDKIYQITHLPNPTDTIAPHTINKGQLVGPSGIKKSSAILKIDQDLDKPIVAFLAPPNNANIAGPALVNGTAYDENPGLLKVQMRIAALEGPTGTTIVNSGNGYIDPAGAAVASTVWHDLTGTSVWSVNLNSSANFYNVGLATGAYPSLPDTGPGSHEGRFLLEVRAIDLNNKIGNSVTRIIRFDDSIPKFNSISIAPNTYVKETITITGTLTDDIQINTAQISFDGGVSYTALTPVTDYTVVDIKTYNLHITIDTKTDTRIPASILTNKNGILNLRLRATDNANYQTIHYLDLYVDNFFPNGVFTPGPGVTPDDLNNVLPAKALLKGTATDDGAGVTVKSIEKVEIYFTRGTDVLRLTDGATAPYITEDFGNGQGFRPYTTDPLYKTEILKTHVYAVHGKELQASGTGYIWLYGMDSSAFSDGPLTIHFVIHDTAGNRTHNTQAGFVKNNKPVITSITTGTDLNYSDVVEAAEQFTYTSSFNARNRLYLQINTTGGNGTLTYEVTESSIPVPGAPSGTTNSGTVDISSFADGPRTYQIKVTDSVGIEVTQNFVYSVLQTDSVAPTVSILNSVQSHVPVVLGVPQGHLEETANNPLNPGVRPAVSGRMYIKGTANDNIRIKELRMTLDGLGTDVLVAQWSNVTKTLESVHADFTIDTQTMTVSGGHSITWTYDWQTHTVTNSAGLNVPLSVDVQDYRSGSPPPVSANSSYDVVPYITSITTTQLANGGIKAQNIRSVSGKYSVKTGTIANFITVNGFNLRPITNGVRISSSAHPSGLSGITLQGYALPFTAPSSPYTTLVVSNSGTSGSGYFNVIAGTAAEPIPTINNINDNTLNQNKEPNPTTGNLLLNDDRYINFFTVTNTGLTNSFFAKMMIDTDGVTPIWGYVQGTAASDLQVRRGTTGSSNIGIVRILSADQLAMARDEDNRYHMISINNFNNGRMVYFNHVYETLNPPDGGATAPYWYGYPGWQSATNGNNALDLDSNNIGGLALGRVNNINLVARGRSNTTGQYTRLYMAWYDNFEGNLYFRNWRVGLGVTGGFNLNAGYGQSNLNDVTGVTRDASARLVATSASPYLALGVTDQNYVILVYYDQNDGYLKLVHSATTAGGSTPAPVNMAAPLSDTLYWSTPRNIGPQYSGWYVSMFVENDDNAATQDAIHLAFYDSNNADLYYAYLTDYSDTVPKVARVEAKFSVGIYTDIKVNGGKPWIAYYNNSENGTRESIKLARYNGTLPTVHNGANLDETVTGHWETMTVPVNAVPQGGLNKFTRVNLDFNSSNRPVVGFSTTQLEYSVLLAETP